MDGRGGTHREGQGAERPAVAFRARMGAARDDRLGSAMAELVEALGGLVERLALTREEMRAVIAFLTEVGEACSDRRQEWVLLADTLGLSSTVEAVAVRRPAGATPNTLAGPFYRADAPSRADGESMSLDGRGEPLEMRLRVTDLDGEPVAGALVEVWQANGDGLYENQEPDLQPEFNLRGRYRSGADGRVTIRSVRPAGYDVPGDGPVGQLIARLGVGLRRPAHVHFRITAAGFQRLTTHLFDAADPAVERDPLFAVHPALLVQMEAAPGGGWRMEHRFVLARARAGEELV
jgi:protocatechuate 3,4-dioxygenase beta subunit